jgi:predicted DNA repair protein MutK
MPGASLLTLLDDIASVLDDVAALSKVAVRKTAGVLGDDLALNAQQISGVSASRELPVVWAVAVGSMRNKLILVPVALVLSAFAPTAIAWLLVAGGAYLCFEGVEKIAHRWLHPAADQHPEQHGGRNEFAPTVQDIVDFERLRIAGAIRTDFILSAEIIVIALGTIQTQPLELRIVTLSVIAVFMTVGVYGLVAMIVKMDDVGLWHLQGPGTGMTGLLRRAVGRALLAVAPRMLRLLSVVGTLAMFLVGGGIVVHGFAPLAELSHQLADAASGMPGAAMLPLLFDAAAGALTGAVVLGCVLSGSRLRRFARGSGA